MAELPDSPAAIANGINWIARAGAPWRDLPTGICEMEHGGQQRFRHWTSGDCHPSLQSGRAVRGDPLLGDRYSQSVKGKPARTPEAGRRSIVSCQFKVCQQAPGLAAPFFGAPVASGCTLALALSKARTAQCSGSAPISCNPAKLEPVPPAGYTDASAYRPYANARSVPADPATCNPARPDTTQH